MDFTAALLLATFLLSLFALFLYIWTMSKGMFGDSTNAALSIFNKNELGTVEDPAATISQLRELQQTVTGNTPLTDDILKEDLRREPG
jgi:cytochrome c oxidase cbb3-type subunit 1